MKQDLPEWHENIHQQYVSVNDIVDLLKTYSKIVFLLEDPRDVILLRWLTEYKSIAISIIVSTPAGAWELEKQGIAHSFSQEFFDMDEECHRGFENFNKVDRICEDIDRLFFETAPEIALYNFPLAKNFFTYMKILYDGISFRVHVLQKIIENKRPDLIVTVRSEKPIFAHDGDTSYYPFSDNKSVYSLILESQSWPCEFFSIFRKPIQQKTIPLKHNLKIKKILDKFIYGNISLYSLLRIANFMDKTRYMALLPYIVVNKVKNEKSLIFTSYSTEWQELIPTLIRKGFRILFLPRLKKWDVHNNVSINVDLEKLETIKKYCNRDGFDFSPLFIKTIDPFFNHIASDFKQYLIQANEIISTNNLVACIGNVEAYAEAKYFVITAKHHSIPKITWQHGALGFFSAPIFMYEEYINSDLYFIWGKGVEEMYTEIIDWMEPRFRPDPPSIIVPIGSTTLDTLHKKADSPKKTYRILYGTMSYYHETLYFGFDHRFDDIAIWQTQREIITFLSQTNLLTVLKLHPGEKEDYQIVEFIKNNKMETITVIKSEKKFSILMRDADIIILDCPSSVLLEALTTRKPVFVLLQFLKLSTTAREILKKRAYCCDNLTELNIQLQKFLNNEPTQQTPDCKNTEFLEYYGITGENISVSKKATQCLMRYINV